MNRRSKFIILLVIVFAVLTLFPVAAFADMGGFAGSSDFGSFDFGGGSSFDSWDSDSSYDSYDGGSGGLVLLPFMGGGSGGGGLTFFIIIIIVIAVISIIQRYRNGGGSSGGSSNPGAKIEDISTLTPMSEYKTVDPNFNEEKIKEKIADWYVNMQQAWTRKNMAPVQPYFTDTLYAQFESQMKEYIARKQTNYVENIAVLNVELRGYRQDAEKDSIFALVSTRITDYVVDDTTGKVIRGSKGNELFMVYEYTLIRTAGKKTPAEGTTGATEIACPYCGAPININQSAKCEYCGNIIKQKDYDWVISAIKGVAQRTGRR